MKVHLKKKFFNTNETSRPKQNKVLHNKIIRIIHRYAKAKKKILFVGHHEHLKLLTKTSYTEIPELILHRIWDTQTSMKRSKISKNLEKLIFKLRKKIDIVVLPFFANKNAFLLEKSYSKLIPLIKMQNKRSTIAKHS